MRRLLLALAHLALLPVTPAAQQIDAVRIGPKPACEVATDGTYGYSEANAIQVGGSPLYGAARQRRYLDTLRGPDGQVIQYKRAGQWRAPDGTILDRYDITYEGLEKSITLFLDWYHFNTPLAPKGFGCAAPINLGPPPVDPFREGDDLVAVAIAQGAQREFAPIPIGPDAASKFGVVYDRFRVLALASRAAAARGETLDPENVAAAPLSRQGAILIAYPVICGDKTIRPTAIDVVASNGAVMPKRGLELSAENAARLLHGAPVPEGSIGLTAPFATPRPNDTIRLTYEEPVCGSTSHEVSMRVTRTPWRPLEMPAPRLPDGATSNQAVLLQALIDTEGQLLRPAYVGGPKELAAAASEAIATWKAEPARLNGSPIAGGVLVQVRFADR